LAAKKNWPVAGALTFCG